MTDRVIVAPDLVAEAKTGVTTELNWYEQSVHTAGIDLTLSLRDGKSEAVYKKS